MSSDTTESQPKSSNANSSANVCNLKNMWQRGEVRTRTGPPVHSKDRASLLMLSGFNVKNRAAMWQNVAAEKPIQKCHGISELAEAQTGTAVQNRIEMWKKVSQSNVPVGSQAAPKDLPDQDSTPIDLKSRIQEYQVAAQKSTPPGFQTAPKDLPDQESTPIDLKSRIQGYQVAAQQSAPVGSQAAPKDLPDQDSTPIDLKSRIQEYQVAAQQSTSPVNPPDVVREPVADCPVEISVKERIHEYASEPTSVTPVSPALESKPSDWEAVQTIESEPADDTAAVVVPSSSPPLIISPTDQEQQQQQMTAVCQYDYTAAEPDEVSFLAGDIIHDIEQVDEGWWLGTNAEGQTGLFPSNYVKLIS